MLSQDNNDIERQSINVDNMNIPIYRSFLNCPENDFLNKSDSDVSLQQINNQRDIDNDKDDNVNFKSMLSRRNFNCHNDANFKMSQDQRIDSPFSTSPYLSKTSKKEDNQISTGASKLDAMHLFDSKEKLQEKKNKVVMAIGIGLCNFSVSTMAASNRFAHQNVPS